MNKINLVKPLLLLQLLPHTVVATAKTELSPLVTPKTSARPFRHNFIKFDEDLDRDKPLSMDDNAGFTLSSGVFIGNLSRGWVGGLSIETKKILWWLKADTELTAPIGSFGSWVTLAHRDGTLQKVDALTGSVLWESKLESFVARPMHLSGNTLYCVTASQIIYSIDYSSGKTNWLFDGGFPDSMALKNAAKPALFGNSVIFGVDTGELIAVNQINGKLQWRYNPAYNNARFHDVVGKTIIINRHAVVSRYDGLVASIELDGTLKAVKWKAEYPSVSTSEYRNERLFVATSSGDIIALDIHSGKEIWRSSTGTTVSNLTAGETILFSAGTNGRITAIDIQDGKRLWHDDIGGEISSPPILTEEVIYYSTGLKNMYGYRFK